MSLPRSSFSLLVLLIFNQYSVHQAFLSSTLFSKLSQIQTRPFNLFADTTTSSTTTSTSTSQGSNSLQKNSNINEPVTTSGKRLPLPFMELTSLGLSGRWQEKAGNFILKPKSSSTKPLGVIHFLGGNL